MKMYHSNNNENTGVYMTSLERVVHKYVLTPAALSGPSDFKVKQIESRFVKIKDRQNATEAEMKAS